jgi:SAM-dependent methyltransferase
VSGEAITSCERSGSVSGMNPMTQAALWNERSGPVWVAHQQKIDAELEPLGHRAIDRAAPRSGERVIDVGCGCGQTVLQLAERVGPSGHVTGIDVSEPMLQRARERASALTNVSFVLGDAETHSLAASSADLVFSRFGVMFFADPIAAFSNLRRALTPSGRLVFVCWQPLALNEWARIPLETVRDTLDRHGAPATTPPFLVPGAPGPFAFADPDHVRAVLTAAELADVAIEPFLTNPPLANARTVEDVVEFVLNVGPAAHLVREAPPELLPAISADLHRTLSARIPEHGLRMGTAVHIVSATRGQ